jgi:hypothetical protein
MPYNASQLTPEELTREAYRILEKDRQRYGNIGYQAYPGKTVSPMSTATQKARALRQGMMTKPSPYDQRIATVLGRSNQGIGAPQIQQLVDQMNQGQMGFNQGAIEGQLRDTFLSRFDPRAGNFAAKTTETLDAYRPEAVAGLDKLARTSNNLEASRNDQILKTFGRLREGAQGRKNILAGNLEQFGDQAHAYNNMLSKADQNKFEREKLDPYTRMEMLEKSLKSYGTSDQQHPDVADNVSQNILKSLQAYGVDTSKPVDQWLDSQRTPLPAYSGQLVGKLPHEITASREILEGLSPTFVDQNTQRRKEITGSLLGADTLSAGALQKLPQATQGKMSQLERQAQLSFKKDIDALNARYIRLGQYGSPQHMQKAEERALELTQAMAEQRNKIIQEGLSDELRFAHEGDISKLVTLGNIGKESNQKFADTIGNVRAMNQLGANKFANEQDENERMYKNYQNEALWQWPHLRNTLRAQGMGEGRESALNDLFSGLRQQNISLDDLAKLNTRYSEVEKEAQGYRQQLQSFQAANAAIQRQLDEARRQDQIRQAEATRAAETERQRLAALEGKRREQQALESSPYYDKARQFVRTHGIPSSIWTPEDLARDMPELFGARMNLSQDQIAEKREFRRKYPNPYYHYDRVDKGGHGIIKMVNLDTGLVTDVRYERPQ